MSVAFTRASDFSGVGVVHDRDRIRNHGPGADASALAIAKVDPDVRRAMEGIAALRRRIEEAAQAERPEQALELAFALSAIDASLGEAVRELYEEMEVSLDS